MSKANKPRSINKQNKRARKLDEKQYTQFGGQAVTGLFYRTQTKEFKYS